jgi:hypothetical protein
MIATKLLIKRAEELTQRLREARYELSEFEDQAARHREWIESINLELDQVARELLWQN